MRHIQLFKVCDVINRQFDIEGAHSVIKVLGLGCADNRGGNAPGQLPGNRYLGHCGAVLLGKFMDTQDCQWP